MKLEQQVCSLELAKKLKELGVKQDSLFNWVNTKVPRIEDSRIVGCGRCGSVLNGIPVPMTIERYSAFTVAELGELLPQYFSNTKVENFLFEGYVQEMGSREEFQGDTEADCRANMLIYLLENKLITL